MPTGVYKRTEKHMEQIKKDLGNGFRGKHTEESKQRMSISHKKLWANDAYRSRVSASHKGQLTNEENANWKGDSASLVAIHNWVRRRKPAPDNCPICGESGKKLELSNEGHTYKRELGDYTWLCHRCHMIEDGRMDRLFERRVA